MSNKARIAALIGVFWAGLAQAQQPMSAIDWLSESVATPPPSESAVTESAEPEAVTVRPITVRTLDSVGLYPAAQIGLPVTLWGASAPEEIARLVGRDYSASLPAIRDLVTDIVLAELAPPSGAEHDGALLAARIDQLLQLGALDDAAALLEKSGAATPALFRRAFDVALLLGTEDAACNQLRSAPDISPSFQARIFCLARGGDWNAAALTLETGEALGYIDAETALLMAHFLEAELADELGPPPLPPRPSPLIFRVAEAIGEPYTTAPLPRAFAHADLRRTAGWKAQLEAAERLARTGVLSANRLFTLYSARQPAASGAIWDRVAAFQAFDRAMDTGDASAIASALPEAWGAMHAAGLELPFAAHFTDALRRVPLTGPARALALRVELLSDAYQDVAATEDPGNLQFAMGLARGDITGVTPENPRQQAVALAFMDKDTPDRFAPFLRDNRRGEAILTALEQFDQGAAGDHSQLTDALQFLRAMGLEDTARRASLQLLLTVDDPA